MVEPDIPIEKKPFSIARFLVKTFLWIIASVVIILGVAVILVFVYEDEVKEAVVAELNKNLNAEVKIEPQNIDLTVIRTFPNASVDFRDALCYEALKKEKRDTLFTAGKISLQFSLMDLFNKKYNIKRIDISSVDLNLKVDKRGKENYIIWKEDTASTDDAPVKFALEKIELKDIKISYRNRQNKTKLLLSLEEADFSGKFNESNYLLESAGIVEAQTITFKDRNYLSNKKLSYAFNVDVGKKQYIIKTAEVKINEVLLNTQGKFWNVDSLFFADIAFKGKNLDIKTAMSLLPENAKGKIKDYESEGEFYAEGILKGILNSDEVPELSSDFGVKNARITYVPNNTTLEQVNFIGSYKNMNGEESLELKEINASLKNNKIEGNYRMVNFSDPYLDVNFKTNADLADVVSFYPIDTITKLQGKLNLDAEIKGKLDELKKDFTSTANYAKGTARFDQVVLQFKYDKKEINIPAGSFTLRGRDVIADSLQVKLGSSDAMLSGELINFIPWILKKKEPLGIVAKCKSANVSLNELMTSETANNSGSSEFYLPEDISMQLDLNVSNTILGKFTAKNIAGKITLKNKQFFSDNLSFESMGGDVALSGILDATQEKIRIKGTTRLVGIDVTRMMYEMNNFSQEEITDKHLKGQSTCTFDFSTLWDRKWNCDLNSINVISDVTVERGELNNYKPLESLSKYIELKELQQIRFNTLQSHLEIKNKVITISKTSIQNSALNVEFYGTHTFDNMIDYHIKLLLSDLLAKKPGKNKQLDEELSLVENDPDNKRCVFLLMTGSIEDPVIKYDRKAMKEKVKEDIKAEKQNLKSILKEEFGLFKKDTTLINKPNDHKKVDQKFIIDNGTKKPDSKKKKEEEEEDF
ncbi:MAG TPA: AsmA-like C-terminal region-containing protein [Bacteroidia bacterium]